MDLFGRGITEKHRFIKMMDSSPAEKLVEISIATTHKALRKTATFCRSFLFWELVLAAV